MDSWQSERILKPILELIKLFLLNMAKIYRKVVVFSLCFPQTLNSISLPQYKVLSLMNGIGRYLFLVGYQQKPL